MSEPNNKPVSAWKAEKVMLAWQQARQALLAEDPALENDEAALIDALGPEEAEVHEILTRLLRGALHAVDMANAANERAAATKDRANRYKARAEAMKTTAFNILQVTGERRFELPDLV